MLCRRGDDSFGDNFDKSVCNSTIFAGHVIANFLGVDIEESDLNPFNDFFPDLSFPFPILLYLFFDLFDFLRFVLFDLLELLSDVHHQELFIL